MSDTTENSDTLTRLLLISGSTRSTSKNSAVLRTAAEVAPEGTVAHLYTRPSGLPAFNPDDDHDPLPEAVADLRAEIRRADAILFCTPEYAGSLPGSFKNLLDWTVADDGIYQKPVAWINAAPEGRGLGAEHSLRTVLGYLGTVIVEAACTRMTVGWDLVGPDGLITDPAVRDQIAGVVAALAAAA